MRAYKSREVEYYCIDCSKPSKRGMTEKGPTKCKTPGCTGLATVRRCPMCEGHLPTAALDTPNLPFSIVGVSGAGKTNYITVMLRELGKSVNLQLALAHQTEFTRIHQSDNVKRIYVTHEPPEPTTAGSVQPQIWQIKNLSRRGGHHVPTYTFTIFDGAGEDHEHGLDPSSTVGRYINASKAIILVIDPLVLANVRSNSTVNRNDLRNSLRGSDGEVKFAEEIINSVALYIKSARGIRTEKLLDIPVAVVLTKFDMLLSHHGFAHNALVKSPSLTVRGGKVDTTEIKQVHEEIQNWLFSIDEGAFVNVLKSHFTEFYFFGVSSLGSPPPGANELPIEIKPHRVLDPILWLFKRENFID